MRSDLEPGPHRPRLDDPGRDPDRGVDDGVGRRGAPVVGVAHVAAVDQLAEAAVAVDGEGAVGGIDLDGQDPVGQAVLGGGDGLDLGGGAAPGLPAEPGHVGHRREDGDGGVVRGPDAQQLPGPLGAELAELASHDGRDQAAGLVSSDVEELVAVGVVEAERGDVPRVLELGDHHGGDLDGRPVEQHPLGRADRHELAPLRHVVARQAELDDAAAAAGRRVHDHRRAPVDRHGRAQRAEGPLGQALGDLGGLGVAVEDGVAHLVDRAGADGVVGAVADHLEPGPVEQRGRPVAGRQEQGRQRLGQPLEGPLGPSRGLLHVDAVGGHAHEQVGPCPRAQLPGPAGQAIGGRAGHVLGQRRRSAARSRGPRALASATTRPSHGWGSRWSVPFIQRIGPTSRSPCSSANSSMRRTSSLASLGSCGAVAVALGQVLGPHRGAVGSGPPEAAAVDGRGDAPPHDGVLEPELAQELGHLGDVAEHVGEVADVHGAPEAGGDPQPPLQVAHEGLARHEELVGQRVPGAHGDPSRRGQRPGCRPRPRVAPRGSRRPPPSARRAGSGRSSGRPRAGGAARRAGRPAAAGTTGTAGTTPGPSGCAARCRRGGSRRNGIPRARRATAWKAVGVAWRGSRA